MQLIYVDKTKIGVTQPRCVWGKRETMKSDKTRFRSSNVLLVVSLTSANRCTLVNHLTNWMSVRAPGIIRHFYCPFWHIEGPLPRMDYPLLLGNVQHLNYFFEKCGSHYGLMVVIFSGLHTRTHTVQYFSVVYDFCSYLLKFNRFWSFSFLHFFCVLCLSVRSSVSCSISRHNSQSLHICINK